MSMHLVDFEYDLPEYGQMEIDFDAAMDQTEKEEIALREINEVYPEISNINIKGIKEI